MNTRKTEEALIAELADAETKVTVGAMYKHYKKGDIYSVNGLGILEASNEVAVIYQAQYGENLVFIRPLSNWLEKVEKDGAAQPRFQLQGGDSAYGKSAYTGTT
ncbi:MAG TPA: DUF1653 domain-containing protein [Candidatus Saccharimonadales bacterium]|nr:DUF1653 domain-containing protein [Candidatus Saccharimonadales bacterium]